ncbi:MAG: dihydroorotase [Candidatus Kapaibacterium sp.]
MNMAFTNIRVVSPLQGLDERRNLWIRDGVIVAVQREPLDVDHATTVLDGSHLVAAPGLFDMHVHLREPGQTHKETIRTGTDSAANGGFTGVVCMPNTEPAIDSVATIEYIRNRAAGTPVDVHVCAAITQARAGSELVGMHALKEAGAVMFSDDGSCVASADTMRKAFDYGADIDALMTQHCEEHSLTKGYAMHEGAVSAELGLRGYPSVAEDIIIARDVLLAEYCGNRRYHAAHISTRGAVRIVRDARSRGQRVSCEVAPHHFLLTDEAVRGYTTNAKMNPPLRTQADIEAILQGLSDGVIDVIATDHAPHTAEEKDVPFDLAPNGVVGLETSLGLSLTALVHTGILSLSQLVEKMSVNPRRVLGLSQPHIAAGESANLCIFDPDAEWTVRPALFRSKSKNTPFADSPVKGKPVFTFNKGMMVKCSL